MTAKKETETKGERANRVIGRKICETKKKREKVRICNYHPIALLRKKHPLCYCRAVCPLCAFH